MDIIASYLASYFLTQYYNPPARTLTYGDGHAEEEGGRRAGVEGDIGNRCDGPVHRVANGRPRKERRENEAATESCADITLWS